MAIRLPEEKVLTRDELRAHFMSQHKGLTKKVEDAVLGLIAHHRPNYEKRLFDLWWEDINNYLETRQPNGTPYDDIARLAQAHERVNYRWESQARERMDYLSRYTTFPARRWKDDARPGIDFTDYHQWQAWLDNLERPAFPVAFLSTAEADLKRRAKEYVDAVASQFARKTVDKVIDIVLAKGDKYDCHLDVGEFTFDGFEGDIRITFHDGTGFRTHVIVKDNTSVLGNPYVQYPLTFHDVVSQPSGEAAAMLSQESVYDRFGVKPWTAPKRRKKPWLNVKAGDLVQAETLGLCIVLGVRGTMATVYHHSTGENKVDGSEVQAILARTRIDDRGNRGHIQLLVHPHEGKEYKVQVPEGDMTRLRGMSYGLRRDTEIRKACLLGILRGWQDSK